MLLPGSANVGVVLSRPDLFVTVTGSKDSMERDRVKIRSGWTSLTSGTACNTFCEDWLIDCVRGSGRVGKINVHVM